MIQIKDGERIRYSKVGDENASFFSAALRLPAKLLSELERRNDLVRIKRPVSLVQEITEIHKRVLEMDGPALLFEQPVDADGRHHSMPLVLIFWVRTADCVGL